MAIGWVGCVCTDESGGESGGTDNGRSGYYMTYAYTTLRHARLARMRGRGGGQLTASHPLPAFYMLRTPPFGSSLIVSPISGRGKQTPNPVDARCQLGFARVYQVPVLYTIVGPSWAHLKRLTQMRWHV